MIERYVLTATTGRSGGTSATAVINAAVPRAWSVLEYPDYRPTLRGRLGVWQRRLHRAFVETHELLGRGKVLDAFARGDDAYIEKVARQRFARLESDLAARDASTFVDISKFCARGLHRGIRRARPRFSLLLLVRDPLRNMRSFVNRRKNFYLDNNRPEGACNVLRMDAAELTLGELYLWIWFEIYLRFLDIASWPNVDHTAILRTEDLENPARWREALDQLALPHGDIVIEPPRNTNRAQGFGETQVTAADAELFEHFVRKVPPSTLRRIDYLDGYDPWSRVVQPSR